MATDLEKYQYYMQTGQLHPDTQLNAEGASLIPGMNFFQRGKNIIDIGKNSKKVFDTVNKMRQARTGSNTLSGSYKSANNLPMVQNRIANIKQGVKDVGILGGIGLGLSNIDFNSGINPGTTNRVATNKAIAGSSEPNSISNKTTYGGDPQGNWSKTNEYVEPKYTYRGTADPSAIVKGLNLPQEVIQAVKISNNVPIENKNTNTKTNNFGNTNSIIARDASKAEYEKAALKDANEALRGKPFGKGMSHQDRLAYLQNPDAYLAKVNGTIAYE